MKKSIICFGITFLSYFGFAQVGINNNSPKATLDIKGTPETASVNDGIIPPNITFSQLAAKTGYGSQQSGAIIYVTDGGGTLAETTSNPAVRLVAQPGIYAFDGTVWHSMASKSGSVIFTVNLGNGNGSSLNATVTANGFNTVPMALSSDPTTPGSKGAVTKNIGGGIWLGGGQTNSDDNYTYQVPVSGTYVIKSSVRLRDNQASNNYSPTRELFQCVGTSNADIPEGIWVKTPDYSGGGTGRYTMLYNRIAYFNKDDKLRLYIYSANLSASISDASMNIVLVSAN